jgi:HSP20 family molecular chaperone IbpA
VQNPLETIQQFSEQMNWVNQMFGSDAMGQVRDIMKAMKEPGERQRPAPAPPVGANQNAGPPLEVYLTPDSVVVSAVLPGLAAPEHLHLSLLGPKELLIEAFLAPRVVNGSQLLQERFTGHCHRIISLPAAIIAESGIASYADGILECRFRRLEQDGSNTGVAILQINQP